MVLQAKRNRRLALSPSKDPSNTAKYVQRGVFIPFDQLYSAADDRGKKRLLKSHFWQKVSLRRPYSANRICDLLIQKDNAALLALRDVDDAEMLERNVQQVVGQRFYSIVQQSQPELAGKITGMLLELEDQELLPLLDSDQALARKVEQANWVLWRNGLMPKKCIADQTVPQPVLWAIKVSRLRRQVKRHSKQHVLQLWHQYTAHRKALQTSLRQAVARSGLQLMVLCLRGWRQYTSQKRLFQANSDHFMTARNARCLAQTLLSWREHTAQERLLKARLSQFQATRSARCMTLALLSWRQHVAHKRLLQVRLEPAVAKLQVQRMALTLAVWKHESEVRRSLQQRQAMAASQKRCLQTVLAGWSDAVAFKQATKQKVSCCWLCLNRLCVCSV